MKALQRVPVFAGIALFVAVLQACSPALNWRQVQLQDVKARLPCKPDTATRRVNFGTTDHDLQMMGCEVAGALFAISHVRAADAGAAAKVRAQWQARALEVLHATGSTPEAWRAPQWANSTYSLRAMGKNPQGQPIQAHLTWIHRGTDIYHFAVYADTLTEAMTQPFLEDLQAP